MSAGDDQRRSPGAQTTGPIEALLRERIERFEAEAIGLERHFGWIAHLRLALFVAGTAGLVWGWWDLARPRIGWLIGAGLCLAGFALAVVLHARIERRRRRARGLADINRQAQARLERRFDGLPIEPAAPQPAAGLEADLDLFGPASLLHLLNGSASPQGQAVLCDWLREPATPAEIRARQAAVAELSPRLELRQELAWLGRAQAEEPADTAGLFSWAESEPWLSGRTLLVWLSRVLTVACLGLVVASGIGWLGPPWWLLAVLVNLVLTWVLSGRMNGAFGAVGGAQRALSGFADRFGLLAAQDFEATWLADRIGRLRGARRAMRALERIAGFCELRRSSLASLPAQAFLLWDFHWLLSLERWQARHGRQARAWLEILGQLEAVGALAGLRQLHPDWVFPKIGPDGPAELRAEELGHPLLPPARCVRNDVRLGPPGHALLVTGSNMSGKSTLLRAIGVNLVLAQAGSVVCARAFQAPPVELGTSFRVHDSLAQGVSTFLAELTRLKEVVDRSARAAADAERRPLFLLDEILLGTNVADRQVAVTRVLARLLRLGALGAVATHDLSLADVPSLAGQLEPVHFAESYERVDGQPRMLFDYRLRPGVTPSSNALALLALVGLDEGEWAGETGGGPVR